MRLILRSLIILILVILVTAVGKSVYSQISKFKEIYQTEDKVQKLTQDQARLQARLKEENSQAFVEEQARDKLGFQQPGETLYVVDLKGDQSNNGGGGAKENWRSWVDLLLH